MLKLTPDLLDGEVMYLIQKVKGTRKPIKPEQDLISEVGLDSLDVTGILPLELEVLFEKHGDKTSKIPNEEVFKWRKTSDVLSYTRRHAEEHFLYSA